MKSERVGGGRILQPKESRGDSTLVKDESDAIEGKGGKRRCVPTACIPCRKRKSKCDGGTPTCATCVAVYKTECSYDAEALEAARRKSAGLKRDSSALTDQNSNFEFVLSQLRKLPETEASDIFYQIRTERNIDSIADAIRNSGQKPRQPDPGRVESYTQITGDPAAGQTFCYGHTSQLGLAEKDTEFNPQKPQTSPQSTELPNTWTNVTDDIIFIRYLLQLYFTWSNKFFPLVKEQEFYRDMECGLTNYCSSLLVNAMCSYACHFTDLKAARKDPNDPKTAGDHFFEKAKQLLHDDDETSCLTTVQALAVMSVREPSAGRDSTGYRYIGRAVRMALELGMHLKHSKPTKDGWIRQDTTWALYILETAWSCCIGRVSQLQREAIGLDIPDNVNVELKDKKNTLPRCDDAQFLYRFVALTSIVSEMIFMFYAPTEKNRINSGKVLNLHHQYKTWYNQLPESLLLSDGTLPHIFILHMYYWTCIIHLFRPLVKTDFINSLINPREVCIDAATQVSRISSDYRRLFPTRTVVIFWTHVLLSSGTVHLLDLPAKGQSVENFTDANRRALQHVSEALEHLSAMSGNHLFAARCYLIIRGIGEKNGLLLPDVALKIPPQQTSTDSAVPPSFSLPSSNNKSTTLPSFKPTVDEAQTRANETFALHLPENSRSRVDIASHPVPHIPIPPHSQVAMSAPFIPEISSLTPHTTYQPLISYPPNSTLPQAPYHAPTPPANLNPSPFWTPFQGQGLPLYNQNINMSPTNVSNLLGYIDVSDQLGRDGFRMSEVWGHDPMFGANGRADIDMMQQGPAEEPSPGYKQQW